MCQKAGAKVCAKLHTQDHLINHLNHCTVLKISPFLNVTEGYTSHQSAITCEINEKVRSIKADDS